MDDDDDMGGGGGGRSQAPQQTGPMMGPVIEMWERALEKLKILHYEAGYCNKGRRPFSRVHFVYPGTNLGVQFDEFIDISAWLCSVISRNSDLFKRDQFDDPNTVVNKLMLALRHLDFKGSFPSQKLRAANGEAVCTVLEFLADRALESRGYRWNPPAYTDTDETERIEVDDDADGEIEDEAAQGAEDDAFEEVRNDIAEVSLDNSAHNILMPAVDPVEWKTELERVGPKLRANPPLTANEWRSHVDQTVTSKTQIDKVLSETHRDLNSMNKQVTEELTRMRTKEKYINHQFTGLCVEFQEVKQRLEAFESKSGKSNETVAKLTNELAELTDKLEDLKESFESKDSGIHDTSPLVRIKASLQQIKAEVCSFDLRIGVVSHSLLAARVNVANRRRVGAAHKAKQRHKNKAIVDKAAVDDTSLLSDD